MKFRTGMESGRTVFWQPKSQPSEDDRYLCTAASKDAATVITVALNQYFNRDRERDSSPNGGMARFELATLITTEPGK